MDASGKVEFRQTVVGFVENTVIAYGEQGLDTFVLAKAIQQTYPSLDVGGSGVAADGTNVSIYSNTLKEKEVASATNPNVVAVAVMDTTGACEGGVAYGFPVATQHVEIDGPVPCTAGAVAEAVLSRLGG